ALLTDYISWRDKRARLSGQKKVVPAQDSGTALKDNLPLLSYFAGLTLFPKAYRKAKRFYTLGSYIVFALTGNNATHITDAAASGFYDCGGGIHDYGTGLDLPKASLDVVCAGVYKNRVKIYTPVGDQQASVYAAGYEDSLILNLGTAAQICAVTDKRISGAFESRPFFHKQYVLTVTGLPGGQSIADAKSKADLDSIANRYSAAVKALPKNQKMTVIGGATLYHREKIEYILRNTRYSIDADSSALDGLEKLAKENEAGMIKLGSMVSEIAYEGIPILAKNAGLGYLILDCEHGPFDYSSAAKIVKTGKLIRLEIIVRLPDNGRKDIVRFMDMGAKGLLLPMSETKEQLEQVIAYAKYTPQGKRGISTMRAHSGYDPGKLSEYIKAANEYTQIFAQIETKEGIDNVGSILSVENLVGIFIGPNDLSADLGCIGDNKPIIDAINKVAAAAVKANKPWGIITSDNELIAAAKQANVNLLCISSEIGILAAGYKNIPAKYQ
ncbi:MAG: hypothetical protein LBH24_04585, partial [Clostridiales bacterium]|nr:hypothetical protein [Clostridiales bacterium]